MLQIFRLFALSEIFRAPSGEIADPGDIPANVLITADGVPLQTADGKYLITGMPVPGINIGPFTE